MYFNRRYTFKFLHFSQFDAQVKNPSLYVHVRYRKHFVQFDKDKFYAKICFVSLHMFISLLLMLIHVMNMIPH
jgi:hypothetical protein